MILNERGFALPLVLGITFTVMILLLFWITHSVRYHRMLQLNWERMQTRYAAESGLATIQATWSQKQNGRKIDQVSQSGNIEALYYNGKRIVFQTKWKDQGIQVKVTAYGRWNVKQTVEVELDPKTLAIRRWIR